MSEIESQIADLEKIVERITRRSKPWSQYWRMICVVLCSVPLGMGAWNIPASHQADLDKAVFVVFGSGHKSQDSQRPSDTVTVQRGKLTNVLEEHLTSELAVGHNLHNLGSLVLLWPPFRPHSSYLYTTSCAGGGDHHATTGPIGHHRDDLTQGRRPPAVFPRPHEIADAPPPDAGGRGSDLAG